MTSELPPLREVIEQYGLAAKKSLGQHFLLDLNMTRKIVRAAHVEAEDTILEIGPGPGGLTRALLETGANVSAIERDSRCIDALSELTLIYNDRLVIHEADALSADELELLKAVTPVKIVANLPYNISTELLIKWLKAGGSLWRKMALMFQKEVADRILAAPGSKTYGRLSVIAQALSCPTRSFNLPARAFTPPPKVDSTVVVFDPPAEPFLEIAALEAVTQAAFSQRRKMVRSSLKPAFGVRLGGALDGASIKETQRAEEITVPQFKLLARSLNTQN
ncbi:16S rRNA (adenine(1518)-N(6)/adenine(1519)-N(6))-dimethyltransferase RsmA [Hyphococcus flavus]|uniref:Ribosomal RNA small subunit methyltransferase A n=1 Tax=Hyphococcus flavus TaxID=1866326 RepID=A0AAF0CBR8_9PROT|nr:16S rRNA (adenine(1518)-N(6)/adenine(1519)-N(6))-dimethyltransferase RsmA [Hyphococcus flavus]WDI31675.1 16S rRNA (adenine(1518)-N(6)/adenine(1519)-N(6))-dimethyltransferase RsmA [Hyphococcus flavus]